jgi:hypothetical protein
VEPKYKLLEQVWINLADTDDTEYPQKSSLGKRISRALL